MTMFKRDSIEYYLWVYYEPSGREAPRVWFLHNGNPEAHAREIIRDQYMHGPPVWWEVVRHTNKTQLVAAGDTEPKPPSIEEDFTARIF